MTEQSSNMSQSNPLDESSWFWWQHSRWSYFHRGFFWGGLVSLISILSAMVGVALTRIDVVEQQIAQKLPGNLLEIETNKPATLTTSLQILVVEVEANTDALIDFSQAAGKSKTILLLKIEPELNLAQAINIPTDTKINIPGFGLGTMQDAYTIGGINLLSQAVNQLGTNITVDRYLQTTAEVFKQLSDSVKITLKPCEPKNRACLDKYTLVMEQETAFKTIRQRLNIPHYLANFEKVIAEVAHLLDTDVSRSEIISVTNFIRDLEPDRVSVDLLPGYASGSKSQNIEQRAYTPNKTSALARKNPWQNKSIAVQNTTDKPELGRRVVAYLRQRNFRDVYLEKHIPLKLKQTKIVSNYGQVETANYLKNILGFGNLEAKSSQQQENLILQLGEDALELQNNHRLYH